MQFLRNIGLLQANTFFITQIKTTVFYNIYGSNFQHFEKFHTQEGYRGLGKSWQKIY